MLHATCKNLAKMDQIRSAEERNLQMKKDAVVDLSLVMGMDGRETSQMTGGTSRSDGGQTF